MLQLRSTFLAAVLLASNVASALSAAAPEFNRDVAPILAKYCAGCHSGDESESGLSLDSFAALQKGGDRGAALIPGRADASLLIRVLTGEVEPAMPPEGEPRPTDAEIEVLRGWVDAGAAGPEGADPAFPELAVPEIKAGSSVREYLSCLALSPDGTRVAIGGYRGVSLVNTANRESIAQSPQLTGKVNSVAFSNDGSQFVAASGVTGLYGVVSICKSDDGSVVKQIKGHRDAIYDAKLSPDGKMLATCSYDRVVNLWDAASGDMVRSLTAHTGAVFDLAFSPDGTLLASASADGTIKIWRTETGERLDTLSQPEGEQYVVAISPEGEHIVAGGADKQLRMWRLVSRERAEINPLQFARAGHDSPIVQVAYSADGSRLISAGEAGDVILWDARQLLPLKRLERQADVVTGVAFDPRADACYLASLNGDWKRYELNAVAEQVNGVIAEAPANFEDEVQAASSASDASLPKASKEKEPNNLVAESNGIPLPGVVRGVIGAATESGTPDVDLYKFHASAGEQVVLEIKAARDKSPLDSRVEVLTATGEPIPRVVLQAVRKSYFTFRGIDSRQHNDFRLHAWEDMELNEYLYTGGEVVKLWLYPRGPDSGFLVYPGIGGTRYTYFGTTGLSHALNENCYVVEPHAPGETLIPNGLPQFTLYYENDDDGWRRMGDDSRLTFTAPADGDYLVRVSDVRGFGGDEYKYTLTVRAPRPDFKIKLDAADLTINAGSGKEFSVEATRVDEFDGEIRVDVTNLPPGFHATSPLVIQAGQKAAYGTITADADAPALTAENAKAARVTASATIGGREVVKDAVELGELKLAERPTILVRVEPVAPATELIVAPGQTIRAVVRLERNGYDGEVGFGNEYAGRNLPHGVYIDNIGLNGLTLLSGDSERMVFITAAKWVPETDRPFHLRAGVEGNQTSVPVMLHVRKLPGAAKPGEGTTASAAGGE